jgi:DNA-binding CsgD family transcriptional regulator
MLAGEGFDTCLVDGPELFHDLRSALGFDAFVVGVPEPEALEELGRCHAIRPLILLVHLRGEPDAAHYRVALPDAQLVDRSLREPDSLRRVLACAAPDSDPAPAPDAIRRAFTPFGLSERQLEVLSSALMGATSREIAKQLFISELTVRNHLHAIYERVGVSGRRELLGRFVQGLMEGNA